MKNGNLNVRLTCRSQIFKACIVALFFALAGCSKKPLPPQRIFPVQTAFSVQHDVNHYIRAIGELSASIEIDIRAQVSGVLTNVLFIDGQKVSQGDLLITIDSRPFEADLRASLAALSENQARYRYAEDFAETYRQLVGDEYVARLDFEQGIQNVDVYKALIEQSLAEIEKAKINLGYTQIRAPVKGYIGLRLYDPGNYVDAKENQVLATLNMVTPITLSFSVPSQYLHQIRQRHEKSAIFVEGQLIGDPEPIKGILTFIDNTVDPETGMIHLEATVPNEDERAWPGQFVRVKLLVETLNDAILVPSSAVVLTQDGYIVFVVREDDTVELRHIQKGIDEDDWTVIVSGIESHEKVVVEGQLNLFPNAKISEVSDASSKEEKSAQANKPAPVESI